MIAAQLQAEVPELGSRLVASDFVVAQDGSGDFFTLTEAVAAVPDFCRDTTRILVCEGVYREKVVVPATKRNVILEGVHGIGADTDRPAVSKAGFESRRGAVTVTWDDYAAKIGATGRPLGTSGSSTVYFGGDGWTVRGLTFENAAGCVGQAVAVQCLGTDLHFIGCRFLGNQDTLYLYGAGNRDGRTCAENARIRFDLTAMSKVRPTSFSARRRRCSATARFVRRPIPTSRRPRPARDSPWVSFSATAA